MKKPKGIRPKNFVEQIRRIRHRRYAGALRGDISSKGFFVEKFRRIHGRHFVEKRRRQLLKYFDFPENIVDIVLVFRCICRASHEKATDHSRTPALTRLTD